MLGLKKTILSLTGVQPKINLDPAFVWDANEVADHTPDISLLQEHEYQNIFVPDTFKRGFDLHFMLQSGMAAGHGTAFTKRPFQFYRKDTVLDTTAVPLVWDETKKPSQLPWIAQPASIKGEVYSIQPNLFLRLDKQKLNGVQFERKRVRLIKHFHEIKRLEWLTGHSRYSVGAISRAELGLNLPENASVVIGDRQEIEFHAWMYVGRDSYWGEQMDSPSYFGFQPVQQFTPRDTSIGITRYSYLTRDAAIPSQPKF